MGRKENTGRGASDVRLKPPGFPTERGRMGTHRLSMASMFEWRSHSSSVLSCREDRIRW